MTPEQKYGYHRKTGRLPEDAPRASRKYGYLEQDGKVVAGPEPFGLLQYKKKQLIAAGVKPGRLKIRKYYGMD